MFRNYFKIAYRNLIRDRQFTLLNMVGLSTGLACALLIYLWLTDEMSVDKFNNNDDRLFAVMKLSPNSEGTIELREETQGLLAQSMSNELPEVQYAVAVRQADIGVISSSDKHVKATPHFVGKDFFNIFSYHIVDGNIKKTFSGIYGVMLSDKLALKLFNTTKGLVGKTLEWQGNSEFNGVYQVAGVFEAPPSNATDQFDFLFTMDLYLTKESEDVAYWYSNSMNTYVLLKNGVDVNQFNKKIKNFTQEKIKSLYKNDPTAKWEGDLFVQRYSERYLHNRFENGVQSGGRIEYVRLFSVIAIFILIIACINFMNLSTAKATRRMKEVGIRKVVGAQRGSLILQYISESMTMAFLSLILAIVFVVALLPAFRSITGKNITLDFNAGFILIVIAITFVTALISGSYPALYLSGFKPVLVLKGKLNTSAGESWIRKGLVIFQFAISVVLIVSVIVVYKQMKLIQTKNLGYNKDNIIHFSNEGKLLKGSDAFLAEIKKINGVVSASSMEGNMTGRYSQGGSWINWEGKSPQEGLEFEGLDMDYGMMEMLGLQMKEGRMFSTKFGSDSMSVVFNETAIAAMRLKDPIGKIVDVWGKNRKIIGVVKDFHFASLYKKVTPFFFRCYQNNSNIYVKIRAGKEKETIAALDKSYREFNQGLPFDFKFLDEDYQALYASEQRVSVLSRYFAGIAIIISCLGLFGLAAFTAQKRQKEIGIRKVVGASVQNVVMLLSKDFIKLILIAVLIAFPFSYWIMHRWLESFAYRVQIDAIIFIVAGASIILITLLTISFQSIKAAMMNPVKSLRTE
ncbi:MAG: ABC transporter permease [Bacteroidetes bacterium]|nr:ABC transporter permease [Bacteroidota bacterium]